MEKLRDIDLEGLGARVAGLPGFAAVRAAARTTGVQAHVVGGAVRDALLGAARADLDVVVEGDATALAEALGGPLRVHDRFGTATVSLPGAQVDIAGARLESYARPGALPEVRPAGLDRDLARRDFTVNAIAVAVAEPGRLIDPHDGLMDLRAGLLRVLHPRSFADDPTRALRAARYAARLGLELEPRTLALARATDLTTVSADRVEAELRRLGLEPRPRVGFELLAAWGLLALPAGAPVLIDAVVELLACAGWNELAGRPAAVLAAARAPAAAVRELAALRPASPSTAVEAARGHDGVALALARALGGEWLDAYVRQWRHVRLEITGGDLIATGVAEGPAVGRGLGAALRAKLDGEASGREAELRVALAAATGQPRID